MSRRFLAHRAGIPFSCCATLEDGAKRSANEKVYCEEGRDGWMGCLSINMTHYSKHKLEFIVLGDVFCVFVAVIIHRRASEEKRSNHTLIIGPSRHLSSLSLSPKISISFTASPKWASTARQSEWEEIAFIVRRRRSNINKTFCMLVPKCFRFGVGQGWLNLGLWNEMFKNWDAK